GPRVRASRLAVQIAGLLGAVVVGVLFWAARDQEDFLYRGGFILFAVATAAIITAIVQETANPMKAALCLRPVRWIGQVSYGVYLWHWPVFVALSASRLKGWGWDISGWRLAIVHLAVTFGIAALSYYLVELPIRQKRYQHKVVPKILVLSG